MNLLSAAGANFVSRWTSLHVRQIRKDILYAFRKPGFSFIEVLVPCPVGFGRSNKLPEAIDEIELYRERCEIVEGISLEQLGIDLHGDQPIYVGRFVDREAPPYQPIILEAQT
jgi:2-oxoglutarate ferredoxin oxidoreductase subunit beta